ncbi:DNA polymerase III subunit alpha [Bogoriella caseilytica]|uniref:DNA polymerase III subunit alpha n=1 Tax=Bogoriella caseilytica TaxID=56055 RepID=A0A3N2B9A5_9MICO|nr:DNA polymerase III subunit alpha [Bogoriella caseilytica]ROR71830.1 DNA polymerase III alpha subunit [Bogoriella caseilytica]
MAGSEDFAHLHVHTEYSMLDGAAKLDPLFEEVQRLGQKSIAMTDHGYMFGAYDFWATGTKYGIKPIIGIEAYLTPGTSRHDRTRVTWGEDHQRSDDVSARGSYTHMTMLAQSTEGMHNLFRLGSLASLEGQMGKAPRMDRELLQTYGTGLIATTGCPSGEVQTRLRLGQWDEAVRAAAEFQDIFGKENYYVELMNHGLDLEKRVLPELVKLSQHIGAPLLATNDSHYVRAGDNHTHDALLCINSGSTLADPDRFSFTGDTYYVRSAAEMRQVFADFPEACDNTLLVAEQCEVSFRTAAEGANYMPRFDVPAGEDENSWFVKEVERGLQYRFSGEVPDDARRQAQYEVGVITQMGFPGYFLVVADFIKWAKERGIRVGPGRGSGPGSMVAYALRITDLNPLEHGLIFERFLNPDRVSMPDFDVDFDERRRGEVIDYVTAKYGDDRVAQVVTYGTIKAKQALKDSSRVLGYPFAMGEKLSKAMPPTVMGKDITVKGIFDTTDKRYAEAEEFRQLHQSDPDVQKVVELAQGLEGLKRQWGVHACAVIMSSDPLIDIIPLMRRPQDGAIITQFDYPTAEGLGLLKMDFLGLRNLTVIDDALRNIERNGKTPPDLETLGLEDRKAYELLGRGDSLGVFQLDGGGMRSLMRLMKPDNFEDISALIALYRPGPMGADSHTNYALRKIGRQEITPIHPELAEPLEEILGTTYGLIIYQEQVMAIAQKVAGFTLGQADLLRRAMGKKKKAELDKQFVGFEAGMLERGYSAGAVKTLWDILLPFSDYAFNKAHSAAYGLISYWTAYLKANFPTEYMAGLLTSSQANKDRMALYLGECRHMNITVLPPDVNTSAADFTPVGPDIRFGLAAIRNVGANVVKAIVEARQEKGKFTSFTDFLDKVPAVVCNKRTIESLIKAGAFDSLGHVRRALVARHEEAVDAVVDVKRNEAVGQFDLFAGLGDEDGGMGNGFTVEIPDLPEWDKKQKLAFERQMLGLYVSDHPLAGMEHVLGRVADTQVATLLDGETVPDGANVQIAGLITSLQRKMTKNGNPWAIAVVEDLTGSVEALFFPQTYATVSTMLAEDTIITVRGRVNRRDEVPTIYAQEMTLPDVSAADSGPVSVTLPENRCTTPVVEQLRGILSNHPGQSEVRVHLTRPGKAIVLSLADQLRVDPTPALYGDLKALLGPSCLTIAS